MALRARGGGRGSADPRGRRRRRLLPRHIRAIPDEVYGAVLLTDLESLTPLQRRRYVAMRDRFERGVRQLIREGMRRREFRKLDARLARFAILGAINWIPKWYDPRGALSSAEIAEAFADFLVTALEV